MQILLVGDSAVGKSSLLMRFTAGEFEESSVPTIGKPFVALGPELLAAVQEYSLLLVLVRCGLQVEVCQHTEQEAEAHCLGYCGPGKV